MDVHIGSLIKARAKTLRIGPTELGVRIDSSKQNVYGIFKRDSIDSQLLHRISLALKHDFFQYLSDQVRLKIDGPKDLIVDAAGESVDREQRIDDLNRECMYLRRLNALLEEKLSQCEASKKH